MKSLFRFLVLVISICAAGQLHAQANYIYGLPVVITSRSSDAADIYLRTPTKNINGIAWNIGQGKLAYKLPQDSLIIRNDSVYFKNISGYQYFVFEAGALGGGGGGSFNFDSAFATKTTSNLAEGTNLYWTTARGDARYPLLSGSYVNPSWLTSLPFSKITDLPTSLSGYGITDAVPSSRTITINGTTFDLSANRSWTITPGSGSFNFDSAFATKTTTNLAEGSNLYWNTARGDARYPQLSGSYTNPSWLNSLPASKITGLNTIPVSTFPNDAGYLTSIPNDTLTSADYLDSTGQPQGRLIISVANNKLSSNKYYLVDTAHKKLVIGTTNVAYGGNNVKVAVAGNGYINGTLRIGGFTIPATDGANGQVLKTNGSGVVAWQNDNGGAAANNNPDSLANHPGSYYAAASTVAAKKDNNDSVALTGYRSVGSANKTRDSLAALIATNTSNIASNTTAIAGKENALGNPTSNAMVLSSTTSGVRSWVAQSAGGSTVSAPAGYTLHGTGTGIYQDSTIYKDTSANTISFNKSSAPYAFTVYPAKPTGAISFTAFNTNGTGIGTHFLNEILPGDYIILQGLARQVTYVSSNTTLGVSSFFTGATTTGTFRDSTAESRIAMQVRATGTAYFDNIITSNANQLNFGQGRILYHDVANQNTGVGIGSMGVGGNRNTAVGFHTLSSSNTQGSSTFMGWGAGEYIGNGSGNVGIGTQAMVYNAGTGNTAVGNIAMQQGNGSNNTAIGSAAGQYASGSYNTLIGNTSGTGNGQATPPKNLGGYNTAVGYGTLSVSSKDSNTAVGYGAGTTLLRLASENTLIGIDAGHKLNGNLVDDTSLFKSVVIGAQSTTQAQNDVNEIVIGAYASGNGSNTRTIGNINSIGFYIPGNLPNGSAGSDSVLVKAADGAVKKISPLFYNSGGGGGATGVADSSRIYLTSIIGNGYFGGSGVSIYWALVQAYAKLASTGGEIFLPSGTFILDTQFISTASKPVVFVGVGGGLLGSPNTGNVTTIVTHQGGTNMFYFKAPRCALRGVFIFNDNYSGATGIAIKVREYGFSTYDVNIAGFSNGLNIDSCAYFTLEKSRFFSQDSDIVIRNSLNNDDGDSRIINCVFYSGITRAKFANIVHYTSGGLSVIGSKFNNSLLNNIQYVYYGNFASGFTSDLTFDAATSIENGYKYGIYLKSNSHFAGNINIQCQFSCNKVNATDIYLDGVANVSIASIHALPYSSDTAVVLNNVSAHNETGMQTNGSGITKVYTGTTTAAYGIDIANSGNVGISVSNPTSKLHINGDLRIATIATGTATDSALVVNGGVVKKIAPSSTVQALTDGSTITMDCSAGYNGYVTIAGNRTLALTNVTAGKDITIVITQDATGSRTLTLPATSLVPNGFGTGTTINLSTAAGKVDMIQGKLINAHYYWTVIKDFQ